MPAWCSALLGASLLLIAATASAQSRIEGSVQWADGTAAAAIAISVPELKRDTTTDPSGRFAFDDVRPGIRVTVDAYLDKRIVGRAYVLVTLRVEHVEMQLAGTVSNPTPAPKPPPRLLSPATTVSGGSSGTDTVIYDANGMPVVSSDVTVVASLPMLSASTEAGKVTLEPEQVAALPSLGASDIFRALQWLPGVSSNETSSGLFVRGGTPDQNLVDFDGFTVYSVDHLFGYFSAFNMDAIDSVDLSKGAYEARYGGRLASLTEIRAKSRPTQVQGMVGGSALSVDGLFQLPIGSKASVMVAHRRSFQSPLYDRILGLVSTDAGPGPGPGGRFPTIFNSQPISGFDDSNGRFEWQPTTRDQFSVSTYIGHDEVDNSRDLQLPTQFLEQIAARGLTFSGEFKITDVREYRNTGVSARWNRDWSDIFRTSMTVGRSDYDTLTQRSSNVGGRQGGTGELNVVDDTTVTLSAPITFNASHELTLGAQRTANRVVFEFANNLAATTGPNGAQIGALASQLNRATTGTTTSAFVQHRMMLGTRLIAMPGLRVTQSSLTNERYVEPRMTATWLATERLRFKGAWGQYHQFVNRLVREDVFQGNREFWALSDGTTVPVAASTNASVGAAYQTNRLLLDGEVFSRDIKNLSQLAPRLTGSTDSVDLSNYFYTGSGRSKGVELLAQMKRGRHSGWASYTWSRVVYDFPELSEPFPADQDRTHELKLVDIFNLGRWTASATWVLSSGTPYTEPAGVEPVTFEGPNGGSVTFERIVIGDKNAARLPTYHRLDLALNHVWQFPSNRSATLGVTAFNAYDRANVWYREYTSVQGEIVENNIGLMPRTFNAFLSIKF
jgi:ferric enterobactin receptor